ncbi:MAG: hypothetical protein ACXAC5_24470 [Promethearchaeota archaeon]
MGRGGTILGLIGLILGAGGIGLGGFAWLTVSNLETQLLNFGVQTTWYKENDTTFSSFPSGTYLTFSGLTIEFQLGSNESVYFSFTAWARITRVPGDWSLLWVYFRVDGILDTSRCIRIGTWDGDSFDDFSISLQDVRQDLPIGVHNVTVAIYGTSSGNYISDSSLFVQRLTG